MKLRETIDTDSMEAGSDTELSETQCNGSNRALIFVLGSIFGTALTATLGLFLNKTSSRSTHHHSSKLYSDPDQERRHSHAVSTHNKRVLNIDSVFRPKLLQSTVILITGANRGLGLALTQTAMKCGARVIALCRSTSPELTQLKPFQIIENIDVQSDSSMELLKSKLNQLKLKVDVVVNSAGYFSKQRESLIDHTMDFSDELKTIDICAVGMLRVTYAMLECGAIRKGSKVVMITSQGGSVEWRDVQSQSGGDYGHHMSKAAANMMGKLCANELKSMGIAVGVFHPGFNKTQMTKKYESIWEKEGAVDPMVGAKRVLHEITCLDMETTGCFINCEDSLLIPW
uniref:Protochlorophyllide reductase n=1 Tax=Timspurckia oligopyrenoides TaxID=708627 RepID=A0A7S0ZHY9_9RHOD|mmetsp:Transcript_533/g.957  ORF Transcript_533/g.957 Transcript_533/m.957 type:complete len:343 (+) Transcript_533:275-1303(+)